MILQEPNSLPQSDINKIITQFKYTFEGTSPVVEAQNVDVLPNDELHITESEMILKKYSSFILPSGPTSERPTSTISGAIRLNTDTQLFESFNGASWTDVGAGGLEFVEGGYQIEGENLCTNGTFDTDVSGWTGAIEWDSTNGGRALVNNCDDSGCDASYEFEVPETGYYLVQFDFDPSTIAAVFFNGASGYLEIEGGKMVFIDYLNAGDTKLNIGNYYQGTGQKMWIDNVTIYRLSSLELSVNVELDNEYKMYLSEFTSYIGNSLNPGNYNVGFGYNTLVSNTVGYFNTSFGHYSLFSNTEGYSNTAVGYFSLYSNTTGRTNVAIGTQSLYSNTIGYSNTAIGYKSLEKSIIGDYNTAIGSYSLEKNTTGSFNTALGFNSLWSNTSGFNNTALGCMSLYSNTIGIGNIALGCYSLFSNTTGSQNTVVGYEALRFNTTGISNTAVGLQALYTNTTGSTNTAVGYDAYKNGTYSNSTAIGYQAQPTKSNQIVLGNNSVEELKARNYNFNIDQTVGAGQNGWVLKYNHSTGQIELTAP